MAFICRFAPSPTGPLHIGGVRTALFNWLLARKNKGKFYLRIEDTDKERSKDEFKKQIIESLSWVGIKHDDKEFIQSKNINKHKEIAEELLKKGFAYKCYCSEEEIKDSKDLVKYWMIRLRKENETNKKVGFGSPLRRNVDIRSWIGESIMVNQDKERVRRCVECVWSVCVCSE